MQTEDGRPFLEWISCERMVRARTLDARLRGHDSHEVIPAFAGIQEPYIQLPPRSGRADRGQVTRPTHNPRAFWALIHEVTEKNERIV